MERILTLLLAFLIAVAPMAPGVEGVAPAAAAVGGAAAHEGDHERGLAHHGGAGGDASSAHCSLTIGTCVPALPARVGEFRAVHFGSAPGQPPGASPSGQGIVLTTDPPPPRG